VESHKQFSVRSYFLRGLDHFLFGLGIAHFAKDTAFIIVEGGSHRAVKITHLFPSDNLFAALQYLMPVCRMIRTVSPLRFLQMVSDMMNTILPMRPSLS
jgi:hypothetical protein